MAFYTVHVPETAPDALTRADRTVFLREGFSLRAFVFGLLYLLWHRLWLAALAWVALLALLGLFARVFHPPAVALVALAGLMHLYLGVEGRDLVRWGLTRRGHLMRDLVSAPGLAEAEALFFTRQPTAPPRPVAPARAAAPPDPGVIGLFPEAGA